MIHRSPFVSSILFCLKTCLVYEIITFLRSHFSPARNVVEAASNGAIAAIKVIASVAANLIAIMGLIAFLNATLSYLGARVGFDGFNFQVSHLGIRAWASCQIRKIVRCACAGNAGNVFPRHRLQRKPQVSDPGMHHGTCVTHVPWCMSGSPTRGGRENVPGIPGACATRNFTYLARGPWISDYTL